MRVNPIMVDYARPQAKQQKHEISKTRQDFTQNTFKGADVRIGGAAGSVLGTLAGVGLVTLVTAATGGLGAFLLGGMIGCGGGAIGGDILESSIKGDVCTDSYGIEGDDYFYDRGV